MDYMCPGAYELAKECSTPVVCARHLLLYSGVKSFYHNYMDVHETARVR